MAAMGAGLRGDPQSDCPCGNRVRQAGRGRGCIRDRLGGRPAGLRGASLRHVNRRGVTRNRWSGPNGVPAPCGARWGGCSTPPEHRTPLRFRRPLWLGPSRRACWLSQALGFRSTPLRGLASRGPVPPARVPSQRCAASELRAGSRCAWQSPAHAPQAWHQIRRTFRVPARRFGSLSGCRLLWAGCLRRLGLRVGSDVCRASIRSLWRLRSQMLPARPGQVAWRAEVCPRRPGSLGEPMSRRSLTYGVLL